MEGSVPQVIRAWGERFAKLGVDVFLGEAGFSGPDTVQVAGKTLRFKRAVIATGGLTPIET